MERQHEILEADGERTGSFTACAPASTRSPVSGLARRDEIYPLIASLIRAERTHRQGPLDKLSYRRSQVPRSSKISTRSPSPIRRSMKGKFANSPPAPSWTLSAMQSSSAEPAPAKPICSASPLFLGGHPYPRQGRLLQPGRPGQSARTGKRLPVAVAGLSEKAPAPRSHRHRRTRLPTVQPTPAASCCST